MKILKPLNNEIKGIIFDFDATLMDTEHCWYLADKKMMEDFGIDFSPQMKEKYIGASIEDMVSDLINKYNLEISPEKMKEIKNNNFQNIAPGKVKIFPQIKKLLNLFTKLQLPMSIATGNTYHIVKKLLKEKNLSGCFKHIITAEDVTKGKPAPDIFLETASRMNINPENILVLEDSEYGVEAAINAGMQCIAIPYLLSRSLPEVFYKADILCEKGMDDLDPYNVIKWMTGKIRESVK